MAIIELRQVSLKKREGDHCENSLLFGQRESASTE